MISKLLCFSLFEINNNWKGNTKANFLILDENYDIVDIYLGGQKYEK